MSPKSAETIYFGAQVAAIGLALAAVAAGVYMIKTKSKRPLLFLVPFGLAVCCISLSPFAMEGYHQRRFPDVVRRYDCGSGLQFLQPEATISDRAWCNSFLNELVSATRLDYTYGHYERDWLLDLGDDVYVLRADSDAADAYYLADMTSGREWRFLHFYSPKVTSLLEEMSLK